MNLDTGKYHAKLLTITLEQWLKIIFCDKQHISFRHKIPEGRSKETKQLTAVPNDVISNARLKTMEETAFDSKVAHGQKDCAASKA